MTRLKALLVILPAVLSGGSVSAREPALPPQALETIRHIAIQHNGRQKPFDSFARETLKLITGSPRRGGEDPVATLLSVMAEPERWQDEPLVAVPFAPLRNALGLDRTTAHVSYNELVATRKLMRMLPAIVAKQERDEKLTILENETMDVFQRFVSLSGLLEQQLDLVPPPTGKGSWLPIFQPEGYPPQRQDALREGWVSLMSGVRRHDAQAIETTGRELAALLERANPSAYPPRWRRELEVFYNRCQPFHIVRALYGLAFLAMLWGVTRPRRRVSQAGLLAFGAGAALHAGGILMRVILGGRPPVSNFFETMLWLPFVAVVLSLVFEWIYRAGYFGVAASLLGAITLTLADYVPLDSSISPVVAVLRSNLWLTVHVLTIVASYGAIALAMGLAHIYGWLYLARRGDHPALEALSTFLYRALQVGVVLLAGGIMLGAVWANASWGRYWGWDPKETWALITLLWYLALLHGRFAGWIHGVGIALGTISGFFLLLMTYYGVSFYLVGLHSYAGGHAKPLPILLVAYLIAESAFLLLVGLAALRQRRHI